VFNEQDEFLHGRIGRAAVSGLGGGAQAQQSGMTFFITSVGSGKGADLGGLAGADKHCQSLAAAAGAGKHTWRAYLSASAADGKPAVNARDRIGKGRGTTRREGSSHAMSLSCTATTTSTDDCVNEKGERVNGRADAPNMHDILTGSQPDGTALGGGTDTTCGNWTKSGEGAAIVGHHDRWGLRMTSPPVLELFASLARLQPGQPA